MRTIHLAAALMALMVSTASAQVQPVRPVQPMQPTIAQSPLAQLEAQGMQRVRPQQGLAIRQRAMTPEEIAEGRTRKVEALHLLGLPNAAESSLGSSVWLTPIDPGDFITTGLFVGPAGVLSVIPSADMPFGSIRLPIRSNIGAVGASFPSDPQHWQLIDCLVIGAMSYRVEGAEASPNPRLPLIDNHLFALIPPTIRSFGQFRIFPQSSGERSPASWTFGGCEITRVTA